MVLLKCPCLNVTVHILGSGVCEPATRVVPWNPPGVVVGKWGIGGTTIEHPALVRSRTITTSATSKAPSSVLVVTRCHNCCVDCFASDPTQPSTVLISSAMVAGDAQLQELRESSDYSPVFRIILSGVTAASEEPTDFAVFSHSLSSEYVRVVEAELEREKKAMQERITAFERAQEVGYRSFLLRANRDCCALLSRIHSLQTEESTLPKPLLSETTSDAVVLDGGCSPESPPPFISLSTREMKHGPLHEVIVAPASPALLEKTTREPPSPHCLPLNSTTEEVSVILCEGEPERKQEERMHVQEQATRDWPPSLVSSSIPPVTPDVAGPAIFSFETDDGVCEPPSGDAPLGDESDEEEEDEDAKKREEGEEQSDGSEPQTSLHVFDVAASLPISIPAALSSKIDDDADEGIVQAQMANDGMFE